MNARTGITRRHALAGATGLLATPLIARHALADTRGVSDTEIIIGCMTDLSGVTAVQGTNNAQALRMAFDEANEKAASMAARCVWLSRTCSTSCRKPCRR